MTSAVADPEGPRGHAPKLIKMCNRYGIVADNSVKYLPPDSFYGIQILQNSISAVSFTPSPNADLLSHFFHLKIHHTINL